ncbi:hypothetical protein LZP69_12635 [Shewanella sp. AS1]|uniref:hypothetical protein n=1 Tax=Shewanella sp. AS1 TaxID=2907626 RepID=UPI001F347D38|nr:hypothetical protein [Shewanella sp. AS1]MCE9680011.1 hypothetical protein [Shewanella sp. AS1]
MKDISQQIRDINHKIALVMQKMSISSPGSEDFSVLVSELLTHIDQRETYLQTLIDEGRDLDADFLSEQYQLSQTFIAQARKVMDECQSLLQGQQNTNRQINAYKAIESNR